MEKPVVMSSEEKVALVGRMEKAVAEHALLPPRERRERSWGRVLAMAVAGARVADRARRCTFARPLVIWVLGATEEVEGALADQGSFDDANFLDRQPCEVLLISNSNKSEVRHWGSVTPAEGEPPRIRLIPLQQVLMEEHKIQRPDMNAMLGDMDSAATWLRTLTEMESTRLKRLLALNTLLGMRFRISEQCGKTMMQHFGPACYSFRNCASGLAGESTAEYDDNGWGIVVRGFERVNAVLSMASRLSAELHDAMTQEPRQKIPAIFWGIIDLKYNSKRPFHERIKLLETGDGRSSRFSHDGSSIPKNFRAKYSLENGVSGGRHAVVSANKKLTHDLWQRCGYGHLLPRQVCCARTYCPSLRTRILHELGLSGEQLVVLKLCNRSRGAGVVVVSASKLDVKLKELLTPPADLETWSNEQLKHGLSHALQVEWGSYEEQLRHWWSNECPFFLAEEFCTSSLIEKDGRYYDATLRIAFAIVRKAGGWQKDKEPTKLEPGNLLAEHMPPAKELEVRWLGGYWKLPKADVGSCDLRASVVSAARAGGTAPVETGILQEVYAAMGDSVQQLFGGSEPSPRTLISWYAEEDPVLAAYLVARLAIAMRELHSVRRCLQLAGEVAAAAPAGNDKSCAESFIHRGFGILEAMTPPFKRWLQARECFSKSLNFLPANAASLYLLGMAELELKKPASAAAFMERSLVLDLDFKAPAVNLGVSYLRLGKFDFVIDVSEACLQRYPDSPQCYYHIGVALYQKAQNLHGRIASLEAASLRQRALASLKSARESEEGIRLTKKGLRGGPGCMNSPWLDEDDAMVEALEQTKASPSVRLPSIKLPDEVGWRLFGWRN